MTIRFVKCSMGMLREDEKDAALVRRVVDEIWNEGAIDLADELFASTYVNHGGLIPDLVKGPEGIKLSVALFRAAFPDLHVRVDSLSSTHGTVRLGWTARSDATAAVSVGRALAGTSNSLVSDGQITESWTECDSSAALRELTGRGSPADRRSTRKPETLGVSGNARSCRF